MINFQHISSDSELLNSIEKLYLESFPPEERRDFSKIRNLLNKAASQFNIIAMSDSNGFIGFLSYWSFANYIYGEHFAVEPLRRGGGIGSMVIDKFKEIAGNKPIILEVEVPLDEMSKRRIGFYERLGFILRNDIFYFQPPYEEGMNGLELKLMHTGNLEKSLLEKYSEEIKKVVYGIK